MLLFAAVSASASANDFLDNPSKVIKLSDYRAFSVVGELQRDEKLRNGRTAQHFGSAVIVSPCHILTNFHVAFGADKAPIAGNDYTAIF